MRALAERSRIEPPHAREYRIEQAQPPVACEHRNRLGKIVERLALHADQGFEAPLEIEAAGHVMKEIGHAAFGIGRRDHAQRAAVRQVPGMFPGFERAIGGLELRLPLAEVCLLRQLASGAQPVEHGRVCRALVEKAGVEVPQRAIGGVVEGEPPIGAEDGDTGRQLVERAPMGVDHALDLGTHGLGFGGIDADPRAAAPGRIGANVEAAAAAADDGRKASGKNACRLVRAQKLLARGLVE